MNKYPVSNPRNIKAEIKNFLGLAATAILFDIFVIIILFC